MEDKIKQCQVCHKNLTEKDDVVVCPECGAPYHRECYNLLGHCALEELHGTDMQYDKQSKKAEQPNTNETLKIHCPHCDRIIDNDADFCPYCGISLNGGSGENEQLPPQFKTLNIVMPDLYGGVDKNAQCEGVSVKSIRRFVGPNSQYYIPRFMGMFKNKISWNWAGFLFPYVWCFYRKMYKEGFLVLLTFITSYVASTPLYKFIISIQSSLPQGFTRTQFLSALTENMSLISSSTILLAMLGSLISVVVRLFVGLGGNYLYKKHTISTIKQIKENGEDEAAEFVKKGGINPMLMALFLILSTYLQQIIVMFFL